MTVQERNAEIFAYLDALKGEKKMYFYRRWNMGRVTLGQVRYETEVVFSPDTPYKTMPSDVPGIEAAQAQFQISPYTPDGKWGLPVFVPDAFPRLPIPQGQDHRLGFTEQRYE